MSRLHVLVPLKNGLVSHHPGSLIGMVAAIRMPSGRFADSTWMTSAPSIAKTWGMIGPAQ